MLDTLEALHGKLRTFESNDINFFTVLGIQSNEVLLCRAIGFLLMPDSQYRIGVEPLRRFLAVIGGRQDYETSYLEGARIHLEEQIDHDRRVDMVIYVADDIYPIEVKVWAEDQPSQLFDYYRYFNRKYGGTVPTIYYLTPDRHAPSEKSITAVDGKEHLDLTQDVCCLSFYEDILVRWLNTLTSDHAGYMLLVKQLKEVIQAMCTQAYNRDTVYKELALDADAPFEVNETVTTVLHIMELNRQNRLWYSIRDRYLRKSLDYDRDTYELVVDNGEDINDKFCLYAIVNKATRRKLAWICVQKNLYIVCRHKVSRFSGADGYYWRYIGPKNDGKEFCLNEANPRISEEDTIAINQYVKEAEELTD